MVYLHQENIYLSEAWHMLPVVVVGPKETSLVDLDRINGFDTHMDVEITDAHSG